jgi:hypothetical protein
VKAMTEISNFLSQREIIQRIALFLPGSCISRAQIVSVEFNEFLSDEKVWEETCRQQGWKQPSMTRTRGRRPWIDIYKSNLCVECRSTDSKGSVVFDIRGGSSTSSNGSKVAASLVALCVGCLAPVQSLSHWADRKKCLPRKSRQVLLFTFST